MCYKCYLKLASAIATYVQTVTVGIMHISECVSIPTVFYIFTSTSIFIASISLHCLYHD